MKRTTMISVAGATMMTMMVWTAAVWAGGPDLGSAGSGAVTSAPAMGATVPGRWIVVLRDGAAGDSAGFGAPTVAMVATDLALRYGARVAGTFEHAVAGFVAEMPQWRARMLARDARVAVVEPDRWGQIAGVQANPPSWGLDRIDQRDDTLNGRYEFVRTGKGVHVFVVDTGIRSTHVELFGRVDTAYGYTAFDDGFGTGDCNGHGTAVAGIVASTTFGVAKEAVLHPVRVATCRGWARISDVIAGLDWVASVVGSASDEGPGPGPTRRSDPRLRPAVVNLSLLLPASGALDQAVETLLHAGVPVVAAAGNGDTDACRYSPGRVRGVITVGATDREDVRWSSSNHGPCLDLFAPGVTIMTTGARRDWSRVVLTGTSAAAPFVTGTVALLLEDERTATPDEVAWALERYGTHGVIQDAGPGSPNVLVYSLLDDTVPGGPPTRR